MNEEVYMAGDEVTGLPDSCQCLLSCAGLILGTLFISIVCFLFMKWRQNRNCHSSNDRNSFRYQRFQEEKNDTINYEAKYEEEARMHAETRTRLSEIMSNRLTDNNPNIANLSDEKRPTKLVDEFSELYDNAWTDAFDSIEDHDDAEGRKKIDFLLEILQISFSECKKTAQYQFMQLKRLIISPGEGDSETKEGTHSKPVDRDLMKAFKDERKRQAEYSKNNVAERMVAVVKEKFAHTEWKDKILTKPLEDYCRQCAILCWLFCIQDPPMDVQFSENGKDVFKPYTKTGKILDFVVWPSLYLHEGGNLMAKGVAQFR